MSSKDDDRRYGKFALKMMTKQGWKRGQGLGASGSGMVSPIKPQLKMDTAGLGHSQAEEFTHHWWHIAFEKAAQRIRVEECGDEEDSYVKVTSQDVESKSPRGRKPKRTRMGVYSSFVRSGTLTDGKIVSEPKTEETNDELSRNPLGSRLSDEDLFKACGRLTAHKGARHGHRMLAKHSRAKALEKKLLSQMKAKEEAKGKKSKSPKAIATTT